MGTALFESINKFCENKQNIIYLLEVEDKWAFAFIYPTLQQNPTYLSHYFTQDYKPSGDSKMFQHVLNILILAKSPIFIEFLKNNLQQMGIIQYFPFREHILIDFTHCCQTDTSNIDFLEKTDVSMWCFMYYVHRVTDGAVYDEHCDIFHLFNNNTYLLHIFSCCMPHYIDFCKQEFIKYRAPVAMIYNISCNEHDVNRVFADEYIVSIITGFL
jgi:hypothetical protein